MKRSRARFNKVLLILETITARRLEEVTRRLASTREPIARLSSACGFGNPNYLKRLFKAHYGMTMSAYRRRHPNTA